MKKFIILAVLILAACGNTKYSAYEATNNKFTGTGGAKEVANGIDIWTTGTPPRKFKILGIIDDSRPSGPISMAMLNDTLSSKAKEAGGDAVILMSSDEQFSGFINTANTTGTSTYTAYGNTIYGSHNSAGIGNTIATRKHIGRYAVIKYLK